MLILTGEEIRALLLSLKTGSISTVLSFPMALFVAWLLARRDFPGKALFDGLIHLPMVMPPVTSGFLLLTIFSRRHFLGAVLYRLTGQHIPFSFIAAVIASSFVAFPLYVRSIRTAMEMIDRRLEQAAAVLGKDPIHVFRSVTLPLTLPGIISGSLLCFARSLGEFGATMTFAGNIEGVTRTVPLAIYSSMQIPGHESTAMKLVVFSLTMSLGAFFLGEFLERKARHDS